MNAKDKYYLSLTFINKVKKVIKMDKKAKKLVTIVGATAVVTSFGVASNVHADNVVTDTQSGIHQDINNPYNNY